MYSSAVKKRNEINMLEGPMTGKLISIALPLILISILQQLFNAADVAVVGRFASSDSLAAVGANTPIANVFITFFTGLATGGNVTISSLIGRKADEHHIHRAVQTVYTLSLIGFILILLFGQLLSRPLLVLTGTPESILPRSVLYLRIYFFALAFSVIYNFCSAILRSKGDTRRPLYCLVISGIVNVALNLLFVIVFSMDVAGVALATLISNALCAGICLRLLIRETDFLRIFPTELLLEKEYLKTTLGVGLPSALQGMLFSVSNMIIQSGINSLGSACIAGNTAALNFEYMAYFVVNGFAQTITTFVSQNYGAGKFSRCRQALRRALLLAVSLTALVSACFYFGSSFWLSFFSDDPEVLSMAMIRMLFVTALEPMTAFYELPGGALRGRGISVPPTVVTVSGSCLFRIIWVHTFFRLFPTLSGLLFVYPVSWVLLSTGMLLLYRYHIHRETGASEPNWQ